MNYNYRYQIEPDEPVKAELERHIDTCRQLYNHFLYELRNTGLCHLVSASSPTSRVGASASYRL